MNRAYLIIAIPAVLVATAYFLLAAFAGVHLTYPRMIGAAVGFLVAIYVVHSYRRRKMRSHPQ
jgi:ABC-type Fe3+ transport system permease subunit